jgi:flagellar hook-basal body complex protein FliE
MARQREGDVSTFHFIDNLSRAIRHTGKILIDLIPKVYNSERMIRVLGQDGRADMVRITDPEGQSDPSADVYNLTVGKYDLAVKTGPSYTTQREQAADMLTELVRANPESAAVLGDLIVENLDIPGGDKAVKRLQAMLPPQAKEAEAGDDPQAIAMQQAMQQQQEQFQQVLGQMQQQLTEAQSKANDVTAKNNTDSRKVDVEAYKAVTDRMQMAAQNVAMTPEGIQALVISTMRDVLQTSQEIPGGDMPSDMPMPGTMPQPQPMGQAGPATL